MARDFEVKFEQLPMPTKRIDNRNRLTRLEQYDYLGQFRVTLTRGEEVNSCVGDAYIRWSDMVLGVITEGDNYTCNYMNRTHSAHEDFRYPHCVLHELVKDAFIADLWWMHVCTYDRCR